MASIRRTLSPAYRDRQHQNGVSALSPSHKLASSINGTNYKYYTPRLTSFFSRLLGAVFAPKTSRKGVWRWSFARCILFFGLGFLLGMAPFGHVDDISNHDFAFEIKPPHVNVRLEDANVEVQIKRDELVIDSVSLGVDTRVSKISNLDFVPRKQIIIVTATYNRAMQGYFLNRLAQVLKLVHPPVLWVVVESTEASFQTAEVLRKTGVMYRHLVCMKNSTNVKDRGVHQRNTALEHIEQHRLDGIVYFADDDNVYSLELFESLREISRFGTWPVAMLAPGKNKAILEGPVCNGSEVIGWHTNERSKRLRRFHVDMSGFAFNSSILWDSKKWSRPYSKPIRQLDTVKEGFQETTFIEQVVADESQMEGLPAGCSKIMSWHLHLDNHNFDYPNGWMLEKNLDAVLPLK